MFYVQRRGTKPELSSGCPLIIAVKLRWCVYSMPLKVLDHAGHPAHHWHPHSHNHAASDRCLPGWDGPKAARFLESPDCASLCQFRRGCWVLHTTLVPTLWSLLQQLGSAMVSKSSISFKLSDIPGGGFQCCKEAARARTTPKEGGHVTRPDPTERLRAPGTRHKLLGAWGPKGGA